MTVPDGSQRRPATADLASPTYAGVSDAIRTPSESGSAFPSRTFVVACLYDTFERVEAGGWGVSDSGKAWVEGAYGPAGSPAFSVGNEPVHFGSGVGTVDLSYNSGGVLDRFMDLGGDAIPTDGVQVFFTLRVAGDATFPHYTFLTAAMLFPNDPAIPDRDYLAGNGAPDVHYSEGNPDYGDHDPHASDYVDGAILLYLRIARYADRWQFDVFTHQLTSREPGFASVVYTSPQWDGERVQCLLQAGPTFARGKFWKVPDAMPAAWQAYETADSGVSSSLGVTRTIARLPGTAWRAVAFDEIDAGNDGHAGTMQVDNLSICPIAG